MRALLLVAVLRWLAACTETPALPPCIDNGPCAAPDASPDGADAATEAHAEDAGDGAT